MIGCCGSSRRAQPGSLGAESAFGIFRLNRRKPFVILVPAALAGPAAPQQLPEVFWNAGGGKGCAATGAFLSLLKIVSHLRPLADTEIFPSRDKEQGSYGDRSGDGTDDGRAKRGHRRWIYSNTSGGQKQSYIPASSLSHSLNICQVNLRLYDAGVPRVFMKPLLVLVSFAAFLVGLPAHAATILYVGSDLSTSGSWRSAAVSKPLDLDGNNIYGSDGYLLTGSSTLLSNPSYATITRLSSTTFPGNSGYTNVDNPAGGAALRTGVWYSSGSVTDQQQDLAQITVTAAGSFRVGVLTDNADFADISPTNLRIYQTSGGTADSGLIASYLEPNRDTDWYFFDIINASPGDTFAVAGTNARFGSGAQDSNGIGGLTFDSVPEPSVSMYGAFGFFALLCRRRRG